MLAALRSSAPRTLTRLLTQTRVFPFSQVASAKLPADSEKNPEASYPLDSLFIELSSNLGTDTNIGTVSVSDTTTKYKKINRANFERIPFDDLLILLKDFASIPEVIQESSVKLSDITSSLKEYLPEIKKDNVAIIVWALSKLESFEETLLNKTQEIIIQNISSFEPSDLSMIAWGFAKTHSGTREFWSRITSQIKEIMPKMSSLDLTQIVWALSKIKHDDPAMWRELENNIEKCLPNLENGQAVSLFMMSFAKMGKGNEKLWRKLESKFAELVPLLEGHSLSNGLWSLAKRNKLVIIKGKDLENLILQRLGTLKDIEVASISCSLIKLSIGSPNFWTVVSKIISKDLKNSPHNIDIVTLCSYAWVFKNIKEVASKDWELLEKQILIKKDEIGPNHLYTIVAGFAAKKQGSNDFWREIERRTIQLIEEFDVANLTQIMWGFATRGKGSLELWRLFAQELGGLIDNACLCDKIVGLWGLAKSRKDIETSSLEPIVESISNQYDELKPVDIGMFMWSLGKLKFINDTTREVVKKVQEKIKSHEEMSMIDIAQIISAINELNLGDQEFWRVIEVMIKERASEIQEEGWGILIRAASENAQFSEDFWDFTEKTLFRNIHRFSGDTIVSFMRGFYKKEIRNPELWTMMEEEVKKKLETLEGGALTECASILSKRRINQNEFWFKLESVILGQLDGMKTPILARLTHSFGASEQGSLDLWKKIQEKLKVKFQEERFIHHSVLVQILIGFSRRRKGDHQFWNMLENRILENLKNDQLREKELWSIILEFSKVKRGSRKLWMKVIEILMANLDKMPFRSLLVAITRLDLVKEIDETEKTMLNNKLLERILLSNSDFGQLLKQLSQFEGICKRLTKTEIERITEKVVLQSRKIADTSAAEQMQSFLQKIQRYQEVSSKQPPFSS